MAAAFTRNSGNLLEHNLWHRGAPAPMSALMRGVNRLNPGPGISDFWSEFRKPQPWRWPILAVSSLPFALIFYWAAGEEVYLPPERPQVTYITSFAPDRSLAEIVASNRANQVRKEDRKSTRLNSSH